LINYFTFVLTKIKPDVIMEKTATTEKTLDEIVKQISEFTVPPFPAQRELVYYGSKKQCDYMKKFYGDNIKYMIQEEWK
jgi:hypothetical protein